MSNSLNFPQPPEIVAALRAAGCGILRRQVPVAPLNPALDAVVQPLPPVERAPRSHDLKTIRSVVAAVCKISVNEMISERRFIEVCRARHIFFFAAHELTGASTVRIGKACGDRDHSTILHGIGKVENDRQAFEPELGQVLTYMKRRGR